VAKWGGLKLFECPISAISRQTWEIIKAVNNTTDPEGNCVRPFRAVCWDDEPLWYQQAVEIVRRERAKYRAEETEKVKLQHGRPKQNA
jgi:hypothetical protein